MWYCRFSVILGVLGGPGFLNLKTLIIVGDSGPHLPDTPPFWHEFVVSGFRGPHLPWSLLPYGHGAGPERVELLGVLAPGAAPCGGHPATGWVPCRLLSIGYEAGPERGGLLGVLALRAAPCGGHPATGWVPCRLL